MSHAGERWAPQSYFRAWERVITSWTSLQDELNHINQIAGDRALVWRGVHDDSYGLLSSGYRRLTAYDGVPPTEKRMLELESALISISRDMWPDRGGSALETLAHVQHYGGPTRLIDVSHDPMVAVFFATEPKFDGAPITDATTLTEGFLRSRPTTGRLSSTISGARERFLGAMVKQASTNGD